MSNLYFFLAIVPSVILHEVSHGWVANYFGDPTAKDNGRLTLNPLAHIDPFGTVLLPALMVLSGLPAFGYAKPVPVKVSRLRNPRTQSLYVSLAGPFVNIILSAIGLGLCFWAVHGTQSQFMFNVIPIPPLDGSAIIERFVPRKHLPRYYQMRARALPVVMVLVVLDFLVFHVGTGALGNLENWWVNLAFK